MTRPSTRAVKLVAYGAVLAVLPSLVHAALWPLWPVAVVLLAALFVLDAALAPAARSVAFTIDVPPELHPGGDVAAAFAIRCAPRRGFHADVVVEGSGVLEHPAPARAWVAHGSGSGTVSLRASRRGVARLDEAWIGYTGPLGLARRELVVALDLERPVVPDVRPVQRRALAFFRDRTARAGLKVERYRGDGTEFDALKEFTPSDDHRTIDWKVSARHRTLCCRQFRAERNHQIVFAVDTGRLMSEPIEGLPRLDHACSAALLLSYVGLASGDRVGVHAFGARGGEGLAPQGGLAFFPHLAHWASRLDYSDQETNFTLGLTTLAERLRRRSLVVVLTDFVDTLTAELMLDNVARLRSRHLVVFVSLRDPELSRVAASEPRDALAMHRALVASTLLRGRDVVLRRLSRLGVSAIDATPGEIGPQLVNRYLDIRQRELV